MADRTSPPRGVAVVAHTHWDREWYAPFEEQRARLVEMLDAALDLLESDPSFACFHLDGQAAVLDDYLEVRPGEEPRLRRLLGEGRLAAGPWYVPMDQFCVSAETIVRNLQLGLARAADLGAGEPVAGYLPDVFGHAAQMPQILRQAGLSHALVWRGVPAAVRSTGFWWVSPDGSRVRAEYLPAGYANGAFLPDDPAGLVSRMEDHEAELLSFLCPGAEILVMNGGDHHGPQAPMPRLLEAANAAQGRFRFRQAALGDYLAGAPVCGLAEWRGELRSGARAPMLTGVLSARVDLKQAAANAETALEKLAEPLAALWLPGELWPAAELDRAWLEMIRSSAHDSACGCCSDPVARAVRGRLESAAALAEVATRRALALAAVATAAAGPTVVNPSPAARSGLVELVLPGADAPPGTQVLTREEADVFSYTVPGADLAETLARIAGRGFEVASATLSGRTLHLEGGAARRPEPSVAPVVAAAWARAKSRPGEEFTVTVRREAALRVLAHAAGVPGWGWAAWRPGPPPTPVTVEGTAVTNGLLVLDVDPDSGTFALDGTPGQNALTSERDAGDTYNFCPDGPPQGAPDDVRVQVDETGPLRAVVRVVRRYPWGEATSALEVRAGERAVRVSTTLEGTRPDQRTRALFTMPRPEGESEAGCAFATVRRGEAEEGPLEAPLSTFPARRFVSAGGITLLAPGLIDYRLEGPVLAVTLLRSVGVLARPWNPARRIVAGPPVAVPEAQLSGPRTFRYALCAGCDDPWRLADELWTPLQAVHASGGGPLPDKGSRLILSAPQVSSLRRVGGALEVRVFNPGPEPAEVSVPGHSGWLVDLRGRRVGRWAERFELRPWAFATARLDAVCLD